MTCKHCIHRDKDGDCLNPKLHESNGDPNDDDHLVYSYSEGGGFWVGPNFGCIHHEPKFQVGQIIRDTRTGNTKLICDINDQGYLLRSVGSIAVILYDTDHILQHWQPIDPQ